MAPPGRGRGRGRGRGSVPPSPGSSNPSQGSAPLDEADRRRIAESLFSAARSLVARGQGLPPTLLGEMARIGVSWPDDDMSASTSGLSDAYIDLLFSPEISREEASLLGLPYEEGLPAYDDDLDVCWE